MLLVGMYQLSSTGTVADPPAGSVSVVLSAPSTVSPDACVAGSGSLPCAVAGPAIEPSSAKSANRAFSFAHAAVPRVAPRKSDRTIDPLQRSATGAIAPSVQPVISR